MGDSNRSGSGKELRRIAKLMDLPEGFEQFWNELREEVGSAHTDWDRIDRSQVVESRGKSWKIDWIRFTSLDDTLVQGWLAVPFDHELNHAGLLWLPGYSYGTPAPDDSNLVAGTVTLAINVHGNAPDAPYINPSGKDDYILQGIDNPHTYIYRTIVGHCLMAMNVLEQIPEVAKGIAPFGMSQGGGLALLVAASDRRSRICCADMPFLADIRRALAVSRSGAYRTLKEYVDHYPKSLDTILLFDSLFHAGRIVVPTWMSAGGKDPHCRHETVEAVFERIAAPMKHYEYFPSAGHVFMPVMNGAYERMTNEYLLG